MNSRIATGAVVLGGLAVTGLALQPVEASILSGIRVPDASPCLESDATSAEQAIVVGLLGGLRAAVADVLWLKASQLAEAHDLPATEATLRLVSMIDSRPLYFWINGARVIAYDMPGWRIAAAGGYERIPVPVRKRIENEQARRALRRLDEAMQVHPASAALWIERANIELNRLGDVAGAAASYRHAAEQPAAPYYAARLHGEMLRRLGRRTEALAWLIQLHPQLPPNDESACAGLVFARIRTLERELGISAGQTYHPR